MVYDDRDHKRHANEDAWRLISGGC